MISFPAPVVIFRQASQALPVEASSLLSPASRLPSNDWICDGYGAQAFQKEPVHSTGPRWYWPEWVSPSATPPGPPPPQAQAHAHQMRTIEMRIRRMRAD